MRGFAVLLVFMVHAAGSAASVFFGLSVDTASLSNLSTGSERVLFWLHRSHHGVFVFFVLSGFLIASMWWPRARLAYGEFVWRRTIRIYPAFLLSFVVSLAFAYAWDIWHPPEIARVIGNLLMLNGLPGSGIAPFNAVTWSLFYELTFYLAFPLLLLAAQRAGRHYATWLAFAGIALPALAVMAGNDTLYLCWALLFCGVAAAMHPALLRQLQRVPSIAVIAAYLSITTAAAFDALRPAIAILAFGAVCVPLLAKAIQGGNFIAGGFSLAPLVALGRISYSFYLFHFMAVALVSRLLSMWRERFDAVTGSALLIATSFLLALLAATASWWVAERPYFQRSSRAVAT